MAVSDQAIDVELTEVDYEVQRGVSLITLRRESRLNAFTPTMHKEYRRCLVAAEADPTVGAIVVTGAGRAFCAGADMDRLAAVAEEGEYPVPAGATKRGLPGYGVHPDFDRPFVYHFGLTKPVIAAVNGAAVGLGFVIASFCDIRMASTDAFFATNFGPLGLPAEYGMSWLLPRLVGTSRAAEILLSSRRVSAADALAAGLVAQVHPASELVERTVDYAAEIGRTCSPGSLRATKHQLYTDLLHSVGESYDRALELVDEMVGAPEFREGVAALRERRTPNFRPPVAPASAEVAE
jgi:enoyl-CoA hydratase/carnithine racemase